MMLIRVRSVRMRKNSYGIYDILGKERVERLAKIIEKVTGEKLDRSIAWTEESIPLSPQIVKEDPPIFIDASKRKTALRVTFVIDEAVHKLERIRWRIA